MMGMFSGCESLTSLYLKNFDTTLVTHMYEMFLNTGLSATTSHFDDLSNWNTSKVETMSHMFPRPCLQ